MALKWSGILIAVVAVTLAFTANLFSETGQRAVPDVLNVATIATAVGAIVISVVAELYVRLDTKLNRLRDFMETRFDQVDAETGDRNSGFVEGYLLSHGDDAPVVPLHQRPGRRANE